MNFVAGQTIANQVVAPVGQTGYVDFFSSANTKMFVDVTGYYPQGATYDALTPARLLDTRHSSHPGNGSTTSVTVTGHGGVPSSGVAAVVLNVTAIPRAGSGWLTLFPAGSPRPTASIVNYVPRRAVAGMAIAKVGVGGRVQVYSSQSVDLLVDVQGWIRTTSDYTALTPVRVADTRNGTGGVVRGRVATGAVLSLPIAGAHGILSHGVNAVEVNVTATGGTGSGWTTTYPSGVARPTASTLNYLAGATAANSATVKVGTNGRINVYLSHAAYVFVDVVGYFSDPLSVDTTNLLSATAGQQYTATLAASGGNPAYTWSAVGLPTGLTLDPQTGVITGVPTVSAKLDVHNFSGRQGRGDCLKHGRHSRLPGGEHRHCQADQHR